MPNFKLECEHRTAWDCELDNRVTMEFNKETLTEVIAQFQDFLRGCGYYFDGNLEIVDHSEEQLFEDDQQSARVFDTMASSLTSESFTVNLPDYGAAQPISIDLSGFTSTTCPVCKLDANVMSRHKCFDPKCGLK